MLSVIFDCDGVLIDSEPVANAILAEVLTELGMPTTPEESARDFVGKSWTHCVAIVTERFGAAPPAELQERYHERLFARYAQGLSPVPGITEALDALELPCCVASNSGHERIRLGLAAAGLGERFDDACIFSAADVARGKPAPDLFLHAAQRMGFAPETTIVVEDSPTGVRAALAAGMAVLGYAAGHAARTPAELLARAGASVFDDMAALPRLIRAAAP